MLTFRFTKQRHFRSAKGDTYLSPEEIRHIENIASVSAVAFPSWLSHYSRAAEHVFYSRSMTILTRWLNHLIRHRAKLLGFVDASAV